MLFLGPRIREKHKDFSYRMSTKPFDQRPGVIIKDPDVANIARFNLFQKLNPICLLL